MSISQQFHTTSYASMTPAQLGRRLTGFGVNLLVREISSYAASLVTVLGLQLIRQDAPQYALLAWPPLDASDSDNRHAHLLQVHADATYANHPLLALLPEFGVRGAGIELRLYGADPDAVVIRAARQGWGIIAAAHDKPHGLREAFVSDSEGYCWVPSLPLAVAPG